MLKTRAVVRAENFSGEACDTVTLDETGRHRRRVRMTGRHGTVFLLDLQEATLLRNGDALELDDGRYVLVQAVAEPLYEVRPSSGNQADLVRLAWHIGNRHLLAQIFCDRILIRRDHVIRIMLEGLGARVSDFEAAFDPESGAYAHGHEGGREPGGHYGHADHDHD